MVFTVKITTEASEERMIKDVDVGGTTLILETGKKEIEALEVEFSCRVPLVTEVKLLFYKILKNMTSFWYQFNSGRIWSFHSHRWRRGQKSNAWRRKSCFFGCWSETDFLNFPFQRRRILGSYHFVKFEIRRGHLLFAEMVEQRKRPGTVFCQWL